MASTDPRTGVDELRERLEDAAEVLRPGRIVTRDVGRCKYCNVSTASGMTPICAECIHVAVTSALACLDTPDSEPSGDVPAWQPIATAPKDGTKVLIYVPRSPHSDKPQTYAVWWDDKFTSVWDDDAEDSRFVAAWTDNAVQSFGYEEVYSYEPTHWMPLPAAPVPATEGETSDG